MTELFLAASFFVGAHLGIAGTPLRAALVTMVGERVYLAGYSLLSLVAMAWLADSYKLAPYVETWGQLYSLQPFALALMLLAFLLVVAGLTTPSPTLVGAEGLLDDAGVVKGILRVTRHPFLMGVAIWAATHLLVNGDLAALLLFGSLLLLCTIGARSIDAKRAATMGDRWSAFADQTSIVPFAAIARGRNRLVLAEVGWWRIGLGVAAYLAFLYFHLRLFGASPVSAFALS